MKQLSRADARLLSDLRQADDRLQRLPEAMLEKDVFITEVTLEVASLADKDLDVVFCGGTSLSKAHGLIERMSEDVDFKLHVKADGFTKSQRRSLLGGFRDRAVETLKRLGYDINPAEHVKSRDSNAYTQIVVPFTTQFSAHAAIRPHVQIELNASSPRVTTHNCTIATIVMADRSIFSRSGVLPCVDVSETAAEKLVSFTRRTAQFLAGKQRGEFDTALVRHLYDVHQLYIARAVNEETVKRLAVQIVTQDAEQYKNQHPEFFASPSEEIRKVLQQIQDDGRFAEWYDSFVHAMIYGDDKPAYRDVLSTFTRAASSALV